MGQGTYGSGDLIDFLSLRRLNEVVAEQDHREVVIGADGARED